MFDFFWELHTRTKVAVVVGVLFVAVVIVLVPIFIIRDYIWQRAANKRFEEGDYEGAFDPLKKLFKSNFGLPGVFGEEQDSITEKIISMLSQILNNTVAMEPLQ